MAVESPPERRQNTRPAVAPREDAVRQVDTSIRDTYVSGEVMERMPLEAGSFVRCTLGDAMSRVAENFRKRFGKRRK